MLQIDLALWLIRVITRKEFGSFSEMRGNVLMGEGSPYRIILKISRNPIL